MGTDCRCCSRCGDILWGAWTATPTSSSTINNGSNSNIVVQNNKGVVVALSPPVGRDTTPSRSARQFFDSVSIHFLKEKTEFVQIESVRCLDATCNSVEPLPAKYYKGDGVGCWINHGRNGETQQFLACIEKYRLASGMLNMHDCALISNGCSGAPHLFIGYSMEANTFPIKHFFTASGYVPYAITTSSIDCKSDHCVNTEKPYPVFFGRLRAVSPSIQNLQVTNLDNPAMPVHSGKPIGVQATICLPITEEERLPANVERLRLSSRFKTNYVVNVVREDMAALSSSKNSLFLDLDMCKALPQTLAVVPETYHGALDISIEASIDDAKMLSQKIAKATVRVDVR